MLKKITIDQSKKFLVALSGGIDSMAMLHFMRAAGCKVGVAHCNFNLRGKESEGDELFVRNVSKKYNLPFYSMRFDTDVYAKGRGISIQMAARELRYEWFEKVRKENGYDLIAVAQHSGDVIETFFINLIRGAGIAGLHGIQEETGKIIRPLLNVTRKEIEEYVRRNKIKFREDSSNRSDKYIRNKIRHHLVPFLKEINPDAESAVLAAIGRICNAEHILKHYINKEQKNIVSKNEHTVSVDIHLLLKLPSPEYFLYEFIKPYGFSGDIVGKIFSALKAQSGKIFCSPTHRLIKDRKCLLIIPLKKKSTERIFEILKDERSIKVPLRLTFSVKRKTPNIEVLKDIHTAVFDYDQLKFPLTLRCWKTGDYFHPFGMKGKKKLSDFFTDLKLSRVEKEKIWLLCSDQKIMWVVGKRTDERFRITQETKRFYQVKATF